MFEGRTVRGESCFPFATDPTIFFSIFAFFGFIPVTQFSDLAKTFISDSLDRARNVQLQLHTQSVAISSLSRAKGEEWPFVTIPHFEQKGLDLIQQTGADAVLLSMVVPQTQRLEWEGYSANNQHWIEDGLRFLGAGTDDVPPIVPYIHQLQPDPEGQGVLRQVGNESEYFPIWQISPIGSDSLAYVNFNLDSFPKFENNLQNIRETKQALIAETLDADQFVPYPRSTVHQPVFRDSTKDDVVGIFSLFMPWHAYFENRIPEGTEPIALVLLSTCNETYTYTVEGPTVTYEGPSDMHDTLYDENVEEQEFDPYKQLLAASDIVIGDTSTSGGDGDSSEGTCKWTVRLYPSDEFRQSYEDDQAIIFTVGVGFIFGLVVVCFITYDCCVERRQEKSMTTAAKSNAIISSLFPAQVRDRLLQNSADDPNDPNGASSDAAQKAANMLNLPGQDIASKPIADLVRRFFPSFWVVCINPCPTH